MLNNSRKSFSANSAIESVPVNSLSMMGHRRSSFHGVSEVSGRPLYFPDDGAGTATPSAVSATKTGGGSFFNANDETKVRSKSEDDGAPFGAPQPAPLRRPSMRAEDIVDQDIEEGEVMSALDITSSGVDVLAPAERAHGKDKSMAEVMRETAAKGVGDETTRQSILASAGRGQDRVDRSTL